MKEALDFQKRAAQEELLEAKEENARVEREQSKHYHILIEKLKELDMREKQKQVEKVRESEQQTASRIMQVQRSRVDSSRANYHHKLRSTIEAR